jgi:hypothetical protein
MIQEKEIERLFRQEFRELMPNMIWQNDNGVYEVFGYYQIIPEHGGFRVFCSATDVGTFGTTRSALSWCIADKNKAYNLARELKELDSKLMALSNDIAVRSAIAERSKRWEFRDPVGTKLETKIIRRKQVENQLAKCISWAKYSQQRGFTNEAQRTGRSQPNKTSRQGI